MIGNLDTNTPSFSYSMGEKFQAKTITALLSDKRHIFAAGTNSLKFTNEVPRSC
jgi:hypothetical protein